MASERVVERHYGGISVISLLGVAFVVLKLTGYIDWPWIWVLAPFWIPWVVLFAFLAIAGLVASVVVLLDNRATKRRLRHSRRQP